MLARVTKSFAAKTNQTMVRALGTMPVRPKPTVCEGFCPRKRKKSKRLLLAGSRSNQATSSQCQYQTKLPAFGCNRQESRL
eukprot:g10365.t1